ncbi:MAG TPA: hypothetical protein VHE54_02545 [Puia sp.]|nr:hypothetical protein [Puia sp.]
MQRVQLSFLRQFRKEPIELPCQDHQYRNTILRHFSSTGKERGRLEQFLEQTLAHSTLIGSLIDKVETEDLRTSKQLSAYVDKTLRLFDGFAREEPYTARYYRVVSQALEDLLASVDSCYKASRERVRLLKAIVAAKRTRPFEAEDFRDLQLDLHQYLDSLAAHYQGFVEILEQESQQTGKLQLATRAQLSVFKLLKFIEKEISAVEATSGKVEEWRKRLRRLVVEETYN